MAFAVAVGIMFTPVPAALAVDSPANSKSSAISRDFASFFAGKSETYVNAGWARCPAPITWSFDSSSLSVAQAQRERKKITWAFRQWGEIANIDFVFAGDINTDYSDENYSLTPRDRARTFSRHIFIDYVPAADSTLFKPLVYGFGMPTKVDAGSKIISGGTVVVKQEFIDQYGARSPKLVKSLYLHELGHVLGLAHAERETNVMHPIVKGNLALGAGDIEGIRSLSKGCAGEIRL